MVTFSEKATNQLGVWKKEGGRIYEKGGSVSDATHCEFWEPVLFVSISPFLNGAG